MNAKIGYSRVSFFCFWSWKAADWSSQLCKLLMHNTLHYYSFLQIKILQSYSLTVRFWHIQKSKQNSISIYIDIEHFFDKCITLFLDCKTVRCKDVRVICWLLYFYIFTLSTLSLKIHFKCHFSVKIRCHLVPFYVFFSASIECLFYINDHKKAPYPIKSSKFRFENLEKYVFLQILLVRYESFITIQTVCLVGWHHPTFASHHACRP